MLLLAYATIFSLGLSFRDKTSPTPLMDLSTFKIKGFENYG
jgi:hypothetical protein